MNGSKNRDSFRKTLSIAGKSGTLSSIGRGTRAANNLIGKSGSMTRVRSYAGYVKTASGRQLAFAIIVNNYTCNGYQMKLRLQKLMVKMADYNG
jgi:D-alanyl-D-alanine carboxypeptidase/D-alanyl-D-alanine-endopeptidase (penicillin-binding protein 4)